MWDVPVAPGESFRWVFVTSTTTDATSDDIGYYNNFVNAAADAADTPISGVVGKTSIADIEWKAIASTYNGNVMVHAIDNIGDSSVGIYTPMAALVAYGTTDLFDGIQGTPLWSVIEVTEEGVFGGGMVWTGTDPLGLASGGGLLALGCTIGGGLGATYGWSSCVGEGLWVDWIFPGSNRGYKPLYAISEDLIVVPVPGALILAATGLMSSTLGLKRLRRKHQE